MAQGVKAYGPQSAPPAPPAAEKKFRKEMERPKSAPPPAPPPQSPNKGFDRATADKLKKGKLEIDGRLDLHGMTQGEAHAALRRFIALAGKNEWRTLLVITGKGRVTEGGGVLRRMLPLWLEEFSSVLATSPAQPKDGGSGAFYLRLRKKR